MINGAEPVPGHQSGQISPVQVGFFLWSGLEWLVFNWSYTAALCIRVIRSE